MNYRLDLHTHSDASPDGGIRPSQYAHALESGLLNYIAVTDHNRIDVAQSLKAQFGDRIIVGEEIMTRDGEIVGLFLEQPIIAGLGAGETIRLIREQGGIVYIPHPFETVRKGLHPSTLESIQSEIDLIEVCNGRALLQNRSSQAVVWARLNHVPGAASSDAHGIKGLGKTYTLVSDVPSRENIVDLVRGGTLMTDRPSLRSLLYPKYHRLRKKVRRA
jgi:predicted metal-dependent phosphoesterase TrpH